MEVGLMCFARIADLDDSGKLNIIGVVRRYKGAGPPIEIYKLAFAIGLISPIEEWKAGKELRIDFRDPDDKPLLSFTDDPSKHSDTPGDFDVHQYVFELDGNKFASEGTYSAVVLWNGEEIGRTPLAVSGTKKE